MELKQNQFHELELPLMILSTKYHKHLGAIETIDPTSVNVNFNLNSCQEIAFNVYKELDGHRCTLWDSITDLKYIYVPDYQEYYEITVSMDEDNKTVKHITGISACEAELSQRLLRNFECNTESDILRDDYSPTVFYHPQDENASLLHRVFHDKCPDYTIAHVDSTLADIQRTFSCDGTSVYDFLINDIAEEIGCLFQFDSVNRSISVYDLNESCNSCSYRGAFTGSCPECGSEDISKGYGTDTSVFISSEIFADMITVEGDADSIKNCFKIEGGDDLMTATVANCNPNGSEYIYSFSEETKRDMPAELVKKLTAYDELYDQLKDDYTDYTEQLYEAIDRELYLTSEMMPAINLPETSASQELSTLADNLKSVSVQNITTLSKTSADLAVNNMANVILDARYKSEILSSSLSNLRNGTNRTWTGRFKVINRSDEEDIAESITDISVAITGNNYEQYLYQKIQKSLDKKDVLFLSVFEIEDLDEFKTALKDYCLDRLKSFESSYQTCLEVLIENGVTDQNATYYDADLYNTMYKPYYDRILAIQAELLIREKEIAEVQETNHYYSDLRSNLQNQLDFRTYIGEDLWPIFCSYLREDTYSNSNYISDGLSNTELIDRAKELFENAQVEINKASELQITLTSTLENLLSIKEFKDFKDNVNIGNWITCKADDALYKLRIIQIGIDYADLSKISITFSNTEKRKNVVSDVKDILSQAQSMASSFSYVAHQASQGKRANDTVNDYRNTGLDAALFNIVNCGTQDVLYNKHGISCRNYDDVLDDFLPEQLRIINNTLAFTKDNWKTVCCALGKLKYNIDGVAYENYGLNADHVIAGTMVSGHIYSGNYSSANKTGTYINLEDGSFSFGGTSLVYNASDGLSVKGKITATSGKIGEWDINKALFSGTNSMSSTTAGTYIGIDGFRNYLDKNHYVNIRNGVITANGATISGVIHAKGGTFADTITCTGTIKGGTISGSTILSDKATIQGGEIGGWKIAPNAIYNGNAFTNDKTGISTGIGNYGTDWAFWAGNGKFSVKQDGSMYASNANIAGTITATSGTFNNVTITDSCIVAGQSINGIIGANASWNGTAIQNDYIGNLNAGKLTSGTVGVEYSYGTTNISSNGIKSESSRDFFTSIQVLDGIRASYNSSSGSTATVGTSSTPFASMYASSFHNTSSRQTKTNIKKKSIMECLNTVLDTEVVSYYYKKDITDKTDAISELKNRKSRFIKAVEKIKKENKANENNEEYMKNISTFDEEIKAIENYNQSNPQIRHGFISEDAPEEIVSEDRKSVDLYSCIAMAYGSIQELYEEIQSLKTITEELRKGETK